MIKRITFGNCPPGTSPEVFAEEWRGSLAASASAPAPARPLRIAACLARADVAGQPLHDGVGLEWFSDLEHLARFETWLQTLEAAAARQAAADSETIGTAPIGTAPIDTAPIGTAPIGTAPIGGGPVPVVVAEEVVLRGGEWLSRRWIEGGPKVKHMAVARRADGLTPAQFSERWKTRAGSVGQPGAAGALVIPPEARGQAYAQNHPLAERLGDGIYDAVNEVWFDDVESVRARVEWFDEHLTGGAEDDLVAENWFLVVEEEPIPVPPAR